MQQQHIRTRPRREGQVVALRQFLAEDVRYRVGQALLVRGTQGKGLVLGTTRTPSGARAGRPELQFRGQQQDLPVSADVDVRLHPGVLHTGIAHGHHAVVGLAAGINRRIRRGARGHHESQSRAGGHAEHGKQAGLHTTGLHGRHLWGCRREPGLSNTNCTALMARSRKPPSQYARYHSHMRTNSSG